MAKKGKKEIETYLKLQIPAGEANPSPPVGPALGQHGLNIQEFCKAFNSKTEKLEKEISDLMQKSKEDLEKKKKKN